MPCHFKVKISYAFSYHLSCLHSLVLAAIRRDHNKLLSSPAADNVLLGNDRFNSVYAIFKYQIAHIMSIGVINFFEMIDIYK